MRYLIAGLVSLLSMTAGTAAPLPTADQLAYQNAEFMAFVHFGPNTFLNQNWGSGHDDPAVFYPTALDARQWVRTFKAAGMRGVVFTAKHHDGFCLWPTKLTDYSVAHIPWRNGQGDVVREVAQACAEQGMAFGIYLSPWDRHDPRYGTPAYDDLFVGWLTELLTWYGPVDEVWFDGANDGRLIQPYDWARYYATVRRLQPHAVIAANGPDVRWIGSESGLAPLDTSSVWPNSIPGFPAYDSWAAELFGTYPRWFPAECDTTIAHSWFWNTNHDAGLYSVAQLMKVYESSVGNNANLLLGVPPDTRGLITDATAARLSEFGAEIDRRYGHPLAVTSGGGWLYGLNLRSPTLVSSVTISENIAYGERVTAYTVEGYVPGRGWQNLATGRIIGHEVIRRFTPISVSQLRLRILHSNGLPLIRLFAANQ